MDHPTVPPPTLAEAAAEERLRRDRFDWQALLAKADHRFLASDHRAASGFYNAVARANSPAPEERRAAAMARWLAERFRDHLLTSLDRAGFIAATRHQRFQKSLEMMLGEAPRPLASERYPSTPLLYFYPGLPYATFAEPADFNWAGALEARFPAMRDEARLLLHDHADFRPYVRATRERPQGDVHGLLENADWSTFLLWDNGAPVADHVARCPAIFAAVSELVPLCDIGSRAPSVMLSLLKGGARIPPHTGMLNVRYVCHLPVIVPSGCGFRVGAETRAWREGELLMFDDTVEHEAWNDSANDRLLLIFDVWRPEISVDEQAMIRAMFAAVDSY